MRDRLERIRPDRNEFLSRLRAERTNIYKVILQSDVLSVFILRNGPSRFLTEGCVGMTKSGLACVYCVQLFRFIELCIFLCFFWFCLLVH